MTGFFEAIMQNSPYLLLALALVVVVLLCWVVNLSLSFGKLKKTYKRMMTGVEDGANLENMLLKHIDRVEILEKDNGKIHKELDRQDGVLRVALTKVGIVRYSAFENTGSDLSFAVALLDSNNNGVVLSSLFGRDNSRTYAKPVENGRSSYTLTDEEKQAISEASR